MLDLYPYNHLVPWVSLVVAHLVVLLGFGLPLTICLVGLLRHGALARRLHRDAASGAKSPTTIPRRDTMLHGTVEPIANTTPLTIEITQRLGQDPQDGENLAWLEQSRELRTAPFYLRMASGERLRVEPDDHHTKLAGMSLEETDELDAYTRLRRGSLKVGAQVYLRGSLVRGDDPSAGFRGAAALVLRPAPELVISTAPLDALARQRARRFALGLLGIAFFSSSSFLLFDALRLLYCGVPVRAEVTRLRMGSHKDSDGDRVKDHFARVRVAAGEPHAGHVFEQEVWPSDYPRLKVGSAVTARIVAGQPQTAQLGRLPSFHLISLVPLFLALMFVLTCFSYARRRVAYWDGLLHEPVGNS